MWDSSKIYKFDIFKDQNESSRVQDFNINSGIDWTQAKLKSNNQKEFQDMNIANKADDLLMNSMRQAELDELRPSDHNKRILKMNRK